MNTILMSVNAIMEAQEYKKINTFALIISAIQTAQGLFQTKQVILKIYTITFRLP